MSGFLRTITSRTAYVMRTHAHRANLTSKPAKEKIGAFESTVGLSMFALAILGPSGWILAHLEEYKKKE